MILKARVRCLQRIEFVLGRSRLLFLFLNTIYFSAIFILINCPLPIILKITGTIGLLAYLSQLVNLHVKRKAKKSVVCIWQDPTGRFLCLTHQNKMAVAKLKSDSFKSAVVLILRFRLKTGTRNVIIPVDALNTVEYRLLSARLSLLFSNDVTH